MASSWRRLSRHPVDQPSVSMIVEWALKWVYRVSHCPTLSVNSLWIIGVCYRGILVSVGQSHDISLWSISIYRGCDRRLLCINYNFENYFLPYANDGDLFRKNIHLIANAMKYRLTVIRIKRARYQQSIIITQQKAAAMARLFLSKHCTNKMIAHFNYWKHRWWNRLMISK